MKVHDVNAEPRVAVAAIRSSQPQEIRAGDLEVRRHQDVHVRRYAARVWPRSRELKADRCVLTRDKGGRLRALHGHKRHQQKKGGSSHLATLRQRATTSPP